MPFLGRSVHCSVVKARRSRRQGQVDLNARRVNSADQRLAKMKSNGRYRWRHTQLASDYGRAEWYDSLQLEPEQAGMLGKAKDILAKEGKPLDAGRVVAELCFGFWTGLTGPKYDLLWRNHLVKIFPRRPLQRAHVQTRLNSIRKLRNRVAHHEPILSRPLQRDINQIFDIISWMSPVTARWVRSNSSFDERFAT